MSNEQSSQAQNERRQNQQQQAEREILHDLAYEALQENKRQRRWRLFNRLIGLIIILVVVGLAYMPKGGMVQSFRAHAGVVKIDGMIAEQQRANAKDTIKSLKAAFNNKHAQGVLLYINSPGGSVVQSDYIYKAIRRLKKANPDKPIYTVCSDVCASGGYYIAAATDEIYANPSSIVGSIGVVSSGFGLSQAIDKLGIKRRLFTAGQNKDFMDPFSKLQDKDVKHLKSMLQQIHQQFIQAVKSSRKEKLALDHDELFSGQAWLGKTSKKLGLIDGYGTLREVANDKLDTDHLVDYTQSQLTPWGLFKTLRTSLSRMVYHPGIQYLMPSS